MRVLSKILQASMLFALIMGVGCDSTIMDNDGEKGQATEGPSKSTKKTTKKKKKPKDSKTNRSNGSLNVDPSQICTDSKGKEFVVGTEREYFENTVYKKIFDNDSAVKTTCRSCHIGPRQDPIVAGAPEIIDDYCMMYPFLRGDKAESDPVNNPLMLKINNYVKHGGGDMCPGGLDDPACKAVIDWYEKEFSVDIDRDELVKPEPADAEVVEATVDGQLLGYAVDPANRTMKVELRVYLDQSNTGGGTPIEATADTNDYRAITGGSDGHGFKVELPAAVLDGESHKAYIYRVVGDTEIQIAGSPIDFISYEQKAQTFYSNNVQQGLANSCGGCHAFGSSFGGDWNYLVTPRPADGGTATANRLYLKASGGLSHGGGNQCGGTLCDLIAQWWAQEFGN